MFLEQIRCRFEQERALLATKAIPAGLDRFGAADRFLDLEIERVAPRADLGSQIVRLVDRRAFAFRARHECWFGNPVAFLECGEPFLQRLEHERIAEIDPGRVLAVGKDVGRQRNVRITVGIELRHVGNRVGRQFRGGYLRIGHAIDEGAVGPVLEQAAHEIGEEILVRPGGRIDADIGALVALHLGQSAINVLTHAV